MGGVGVKLRDLGQKPAVVDHYELPRLGIARAGRAHGGRQELLDQLFGYRPVLVDTDAPSRVDGF